MSEKYHVVVEAKQLPKQEANEASKDYEQRVSRFCSWLDEKGAEEISLSISANTFVDFRWEEELHEIPQGWWVLFMAGDVVVILADEQWQAMVNA